MSLFLHDHLTGTRGSVVYVAVVIAVIVLLVVGAGGFIWGEDSTMERLRDRTQQREQELRRGVDARQKAVEARERSLRDRERNITNELQRAYLDGVEDGMTLPPATRQEQADAMGKVRRDLERKALARRGPL